MKKMNLFVVLPLLLSACAAVQWVKPGATEQDFQRDQAECNYEATKAVPDYGSGSVFAIAMQRADIANQCLRLRGYSQKSSK